MRTLVAALAAAVVMFFWGSCFGGFHIANAFYLILAWALTGVVFALLLAPCAVVDPVTSD